VLFYVPGNGLVTLVTARRMEEESSSLHQVNSNVWSAGRCGPPRRPSIFRRVRFLRSFDLPLAQS